MATTSQNIQTNFYCFDVMLSNHALKIHDQSKTVVQTKLKQHAVTVFLLFAGHAGRQKNWERE